MPVPIKKFGRPKKKPLDEETERLILEVHKEQNLGARRLAKIIKFEYGIAISHHTIHQLLLNHGLAEESPKKKRRRKPWIRYERKHSLTAVHLDWHESKACPGMHVCAVLDDSSRYVLAGGEYPSATADASIEMVKEVLDRYGHIRRVEQVITDHGSQFHANKKDKDGDEGGSRFASFLEEMEITHIKARIKHPQTNGKFEKWNHTYELNRNRFDDFDNFVNWYNTVRYHESLDKNRMLQTPEDAFWARLPCACKLRTFIDRMEREIL
jgi:putative transposase